MDRNYKKHHSLRLPAGLLSLIMLLGLLTGCGKSKVVDMPSLTVPEQAQNAEAEASDSVDAPQEDATDIMVFQLTDSMVVTGDLDAGQITQTDVVNQTRYSLTLHLENAAGYTSQEQLVMCTKLFWYCYPQMYEKMAVATTPCDVNLLVENEGYEIAEQWGNNVHIHDRWLYDNPEDYDCLTHEFAHVIQTDWGYDNSPQYEGDAYLIERFADACRYIYAYEDGLYNNRVWTLWTPDVEDHYSTSNRFWMWLELNYSTDEIDIFKRLVEETQIQDDAHAAINWESDGPMWQVIFAGTGAEGKTLEELWAEFIESDFAWE